MNLQDDEQPRGPSMEIKSKYRGAFLSKTLGRVIIVILVFSVGFTMAAVKESRDAAARLDQQSRDIAELKHLLAMAPRGFAEPRSQKIDNLESRPLEKRLLIHVPFSLLTQADEAHAIMTTGDIMHNEYTKFIQNRQSNTPANNVAAFTQCNANALVFNLWYLNQKMNIQFDRIYANMNPMYAVMESVKTSARCTYKLIQDPRVWGNATALGEYTAVYDFDKWYDARTTPGVNCPGGTISIMEIC